MRRALILLTLLAAGCGAPRMVLLDARAERRETPAAGGPGAAVGFHVRNAGPGTARCVLLRYDVLVAAADEPAGASGDPAADPSSGDWQPRACFINLAFPVGEVRYLVCDEPARAAGVRVIAVEGATKPFSPADPSQLSDSLRQTLPFGLAWQEARTLTGIHPDLLHRHMDRGNGNGASDSPRFADVPVLVVTPGVALPAPPTPSALARP